MLLGVHLGLHLLLHLLLLHALEDKLKPEARNISQSPCHSLQVRVILLKVRVILLNAHVIPNLRSL